MKFLGVSPKQLPIGDSIAYAKVHSGRSETESVGVFQVDLAAMLPLQTIHNLKQLKLGPPVFGDFPAAWMGLLNLTNLEYCASKINLSFLGPHHGVLFGMTCLRRLSITTLPSVGIPIGGHIVQLAKSLPSLSNLQAVILLPNLLWGAECDRCGNELESECKEAARLFPSLVVAVDIKLVWESDGAG